MLRNAEICTFTSSCWCLTSPSKLFSFPPLRSVHIPSAWKYKPHFFVLFFFPKWPMTVVRTGSGDRLNCSEAANWKALHSNLKWWDCCPAILLSGYEFTQTVNPDTATLGESGLVREICSWSPVLTLEQVHFLGFPNGTRQGKSTIYSTF